MKSPATLAGMPKAPSTIDPIYSLERATNRRNVVLRRMLNRTSYHSRRIH
ncbi:transglycosylase domain-containing protein [Vibrio lentus]|nr:transglycosylase domain-containing protein [Vibrio lentus]